MIGAVLDTLRQAERMSKEGFFEDALELCNKFINEHPNSHEAYETRSSVFRRENKLDQAIADACEVIKLKPNSPAPYFRRGCLKMSLGDNESAIEDFSNTITLDNGYFGDAAFFYRAEAYLRCAQYQKAIEDCAMIKSDYFEMYFYGHHRRSKLDIIEDANKAVRP